MRFLWIILILSFTAVLAEGKRKRKFEGDFEFADEIDSKPIQKNSGIPERKKWIHDPESELCKPLNCKKKEMCLLDESSAAFCVSKKDIHKNGDIIVPKSKVTEPPSKNSEIDDNSDESDDDEDDDDDDDDIFYDSEDGQDDEDGNGSTPKCKTCPIAKPVFLCGSDNRTYSSLCRLDYHNCLHKSHVKVSCKGFCPCKEPDSMYKKKQKQAEKMNNLMTKVRNTVEREKGIGKYKSEKDKTDKKSEGKKYAGVSLYGPSPSKGFMKWELPVHKYQQQIRSYKHDDVRFNNDDFQDMYRQKLKNKWTNKKYYDEDKSHNEVIKPKVYRPGKECPPSALQSMGNRLLDWFSVVMSESKKKKQHKIKGDLPGWCKSEVRWMFGYLDLDGDEKLSLTELYHMEHDHKEKCVKPFVDSCDSNRDIFISPKEWCHCFDKTDRPCAAVKRRLSPDLLGAYVPDCDSQGYFHPTQCHKSVGMCWCVDKHGVELANSRTRGRPNCDALMKKSKSKDMNKKEEMSDKVNIDDEDEDEDDEGGNDSDFEGSADQPLDF